MELETISTERLLLKKVTPEQLKLIFATDAKEQVKQLMGFTSDEEYISEKNKSDIGHTSYNRSICLFLIIHQETGKTIGRIGFHNWFFLHYRSEIGYVMSDVEYRGKGLMNEALRAVVEYGFTRLNLNRIEAVTGVDNYASMRLLEKNGFEKEALLRGHFFVNGAFVDSVLFSRLRSEQ